jgi:PAS domain S-box-containing protein
MSGSRIMVVEDEVIVAMELQSTLQDLGYFVADPVVRGEDALALVAELRPDLILMDIKLAGDIDGIEAAARIRDLHHVPVVFLTAHSDESTLQRAKASQPFGYLVKPFTRAELRTTIEVALSRHHQETSTREWSHALAETKDTFGGAIAVADRDGAVQHLNQLARAFTGWTRQKAMGRRLQEVFSLKDRTTGEPVREITGILNPENPLVPQTRYRLVCVTGDEIDIEHVVFPVADEKGDVHSVILAFREDTRDASGRNDWFGLAANHKIKAAMCRSDGEHLSAEIYYRRALDIFERFLGSTHRKVHDVLKDLAEVCRAQGKHHDAELLDLRAAEIGKTRGVK